MFSHSPHNNLIFHHETITILSFGCETKGNYQQYQPYQPYFWRPRYWYQQPYYCCLHNEITSLGIRARTAAWLSYLFGWVSGLIFLLLERNNRFVHFHAMQSLLFFGAMTILESLVRFFEVALSYGFPPYFGFGIVSSVLGIVSFVYWIVWMIAAHRGKYYRLPVVGY